MSGRNRTLPRLTAVAGAVVLGAVSLGGAVFEQRDPNALMENGQPVQGYRPGIRFSQGGRENDGSQALVDLHRAVESEIRSQQLNPGAERIWSEAYPRAVTGSPACAARYKQAHDLAPAIDAAFKARNTERARSLSRQAGDYLEQAAACARGENFAGASPGGNPDLARLRTALVELDRLIGRAANLQPSLSNKYLVAMAKLVRQDLAFLAQQPYVPAEQIARSLHTGVWEYLTGDAYRNNAALAAGVSNFVSQKAQLVAQQPEAAAAELTHFLLAAAVTAGPNAGRTATGAQLAAKAEQSAGVLQQLEAEVARRERGGAGLQRGGNNPIAGWVQGFYRDIELLLPDAPLAPGTEPLYPVQPAAGGCGQFSCSSILNKAGVNVQVAELVRQLPANATYARDLVSLMARHNVTAYATQGQAVSALERWFSQPHAAPVVAGIGQGGAQQIGHWVEITGMVTNSQGVRCFAIVDPAGFAYTKPITSFTPFFQAHGGQVVYVAGAVGR